jgi:hypothetical protein
MSTDNTTLAVVRKIQDLWRASKSDSLIDYTKSTRVEPIALIGTDVLYDEMLPDLMQSLLSIFAGYYLQAIAVSMTVGNIEVERVLSKLNPSRSAADAAVDSGGWLLSQESYKHCLPTPEKRAALEAIDDDVESGFAPARDTNRELKELSNLSVGKLLNVELCQGINRATIPVAVRLLASSIPTERLAHILAIGTKDTSAKERWYQWRSGELEAIRDMVLCEDLIQAHRTNLMADKDGVYSQLLKRNRENQISAIVSANPSVATASNIVVISQETANKLEMEIHSKLSNPKTREKVFEGKYMMILAVVDSFHKRVTIYHRGILMPTELGMRDLRDANKGSGPNVSDILKAYQLGNAPVL